MPYHAASAHASDKPDSGADGKRETRGSTRSTGGPFPFASVMVTILLMLSVIACGEGLGEGLDWARSPGTLPGGGARVGDRSCLLSLRGHGIGVGSTHTCVPEADRGFSVTCSICGARGGARATAPLSVAPWLRARGGGEEAGGAWPRVRSGQRGVGKGRGAAAAAAQSGPDHRRGGRWQGVGKVVVGLSRLPRRMPTPAAAADIAAHHADQREEGRSSIGDISTIRRDETRPTIEDDCRRRTSIGKEVDGGRNRVGYRDRGGDGHCYAGFRRRRPDDPRSTDAVAAAGEGGREGHDAVCQRHDDAKGARAHRNATPGDNRRGRRRRDLGLKRWSHDAVCDDDGGWHIDDGAMRGSGTLRGVTGDDALGDDNGLGGDCGVRAGDYIAGGGCVDGDCGDGHDAKTQRQFDGGAGDRMTGGGAGDHRHDCRRRDDDCPEEYGVDRGTDGGIDCSSDDGNDRGDDLDSRAQDGDAEPTEDYGNLDARSANHDGVGSDDDLDDPRLLDGDVHAGDGIHVDLARPARAERTVRGQAGDTTRSREELKHRRLTTLHCGNTWIVNLESNVTDCPLSKWMRTKPLPSPSPTAWEARSRLVTRPLHPPTSSTWGACLHRRALRRGTPCVHREAGAITRTKPLHSPTGTTWEAGLPQRATGVWHCASRWGDIGTVPRHSPSPLRRGTSAPELTTWAFAAPTCTGWEVGLQAVALIDDEPAVGKRAIGEPRTSKVPNGTVQGGSYRALASHWSRRGCQCLKRALSPAPCLLIRGGAETAPPLGPAGRCTTSASPPSLGGGCGRRNRRGVPKGGTWRRRTGRRKLTATTTTPTAECDRPTTVTYATYTDGQRRLPLSPSGGTALRRGGVDSHQPLRPRRSRHHLRERELHRGGRPLHQWSPSRCAGQQGDGGLDAGHHTLAAAMAALLLHGALLAAAHVSALIVRTLVSRAPCRRPTGPVELPTRSMIDRRMRLTKAARAGGSRTGRRRRPSGEPSNRLRARCRRAEAWCVIYLLVSMHGFHQVRSGDQRQRVADHSDDNARSSNGRHGVATEVHRGARNKCMAVSCEVGRCLPGEEPSHSANFSRGRWWAHATRVGEARHPGPLQATLLVGGLLTRVYDGVASAVTYPKPGTGSLRGAIAPGFRGTDRGQGNDELFALSIEAVNSTGWKALQRRLLATESHVVLAQETWIMQDSIPAASAWARRRGWKSVWSAARAGPNGGPTGGVAIFARDELGLRYPPGGSHEWHPGRVVAAVLDAPEHRPLLLLSSYLVHGVGPGAENLEILANIGARARTAARGMDLVMGGDANMEPPDFASTGFEDETGTVILHPSTGRGTFRTARTASLLDYFIVSARTAVAVDRVVALEASGVKGHTPVRLTFKPKATTVRALQLRRPPRLQSERVYGPLPPPPDWSAPAAAAEAALAAARGKKANVQQLLDEAYRQWADMAEVELADRSGQPPKKFGERGRPPRFVWRSVLPEIAPRFARPYAAAAAWISAVLGELKRINGAVRDAPRRAEAMDSVGDDPQVSEGHGGEARERQREAEVRSARARRPPTRPTACASTLREIINSLQTDYPDCGDAPEGRALRSHRDAAQALASRMLNILDEMALGEYTEDAMDGGGDTTRLYVDLDVIANAVEALREEISGLEAQHTAAADADDNRQWREWVAEGIDRGASRAHAYTKTPTAWAPTTAEVQGGGTSAAIDDLMEDQRQKYKAMWKPAARPFRYEWNDACELPRMSAARLREVAGTFAARTSTTFDGFHPRELGHLSDGALESLATLYAAVEVAALWPSQISLIVAALLPKPKG